MIRLVLMIQSRLSIDREYYRYRLIPKYSEDLSFLYENDDKENINKRGEILAYYFENDVLMFLYIFTTLELKFDKLIRVLTHNSGPRILWYGVGSQHLIKIRKFVYTAISNIFENIF